MTKNILFAAGLGLALGACQKTSSYNPEPLLASLTVVNAAAQVGGVLVTSYDGATHYDRQLVNDSVAYQAGKTYDLPSGSTVPLRVVSVRDTARQVAGGSVAVAGGGLYSLYLAGTAARPDTLLRREASLPLYAAGDSAVAVRVVNLSPDGPSVRVVRTGTTTAEFSNLTYKTITAFKKYPLTLAAANAGLGFDVLDASGTTLASYSLPQYPSFPNPGPSIGPARFKGITLVISGSAAASTGAPGAYTVFAVANY